ncbi:Predicted oxidoreductase [Aliiroseovarius halocynthiae]|uniref:Aldo/keto reductase n=1 Tax=Aliiroseovarius halocynthiae TaxID=985055 RepID=A0A545SRS0_9RHOB|nr:aldo/keto reductase [Aliiroseovarius halocynthiae]TQV67596.1 aldo/keto reductase [Aliiroseovarius halocynthiae]SMR81615.1 Predicted oxidoreductase [Aliiroseovarius halocynthiae]
MTDLISLDGTPAPRFAFGTMQFGGTADETASRTIFDACIDAGITHFDTANLYTGGASEEILGRLIAPMRERLIIATKIGYDAPDTVAALRAQFDTSRTRMGLDAVDVLYLHRFNPNLAMDAQIELLAELQSSGQTRYLALSNFAAWQVMKAQSIAQNLGTKIDVIQPMYSLVKRQAEVELLPMCASEGMLAATYSPLGGGLLTGKYAKGGTGRLSEDHRYAARYGLDWMHKAAEALPEIAREANMHPATLAVAWVAGHSSRPAPILSARSLEQLQPSLDALSYEMPTDLRAQLSTLTPTPAPATDRIEENG